MNKWAFAGMAAAALAAAGCGGGGNGGGGTPPPAPVQPSVNTGLFFVGAQPKPGYMQVTYNTGQGRGSGGTTATLQRLVFEDQAYGPGDTRNVVRTLLEPEVVLGLDAYTSHAVALNVPLTGFSAVMNNRVFDTFNVELQEVTIDGSVFTGAGGSAAVYEPFDLNCPMFAGRTTSIEIFLHDAMFTPNGSGGVDMDRSEFEFLNYNPDTQRIEAHFADYLAFDISNVANPPLMTGGSPATTVYFSGDAFGLSDTPIGAPTAFEVLVPESPDPGSIEGFCQLAPSFPPNSPNTYTLRQIDPRSLPGTSHITALQGTWKWWVNPDEPAQSPILNPGDFVFLTFPQSQDDGKQDCAIIGLSGGVIVDFYFGQVDLASNTFNAWPVFEITEGTTNDEIQGTLGSYVFRAGIGVPTVRDIRSGAFQITAGTAPGTFPTSGNFIVYRL